MLAPRGCRALRWCKQVFAWAPGCQKVASCLVYLNETDFSGIETSPSKLHQISSSTS